MGQITATDGVNIRYFTCEQYALAGDALPAGWTITENTCGMYFGQFRSPFASFGLNLSGTALPGNWYTYKGTIASNQVVIPTTEFLLPSNPCNTRVIVRRQAYNPSVPGDTRDYSVNNEDNSIDFEASLGLNGQVAYISVFK